MLGMWKGFSGQHRNRNLGSSYSSIVAAVLLVPCTALGGMVLALVTNEAA